MKMWKKINIIYFKVLIIVKIINIKTYKYLININILLYEIIFYYLYY
jgi:hypothetical protein